MTKLLPLENVITKHIDKLDKTIKRNPLSDNSGLSSKADQLLKWTPALSLFALDVVGVKTKNNTRHQLKILAAAEVALQCVSQPLKYVTSRQRPDTSLDFKSFPSDHTATAFLGAELLRHEVKEHHPVASYAGYALAAASGFSRIHKNKHWFSDVVAGAVIGVACAKITLWLVRKMNKRHNMSNH